MAETKYIDHNMIIAKLEADNKRLSARVEEMEGLAERSIDREIALGDATLIMEKKFQARIAKLDVALGEMEKLAKCPCGCSHGEAADAIMERSRGIGECTP